MLGTETSRSASVTECDVAESVMRTEDLISGSNIAAVWQFGILEGKCLYHKKGAFSERNECIVRQSYESSVSITVQSES